MLETQKIWSEGLNPSDRTIQKDSEYSRVLSRLCDVEEELQAALNQEGREKLAEYSSLHTDLTDLSNAEIFLEAFRLGARIMHDMIWDL